MVTVDKYNGNQLFGLFCNFVVNAIYIATKVKALRPERGLGKNAPAVPFLCLVVPPHSTTVHTAFVLICDKLIFLQAVLRNPRAFQQRKDLLCFLLAFGFSVGFRLQLGRTVIRFAVPRFAPAFIVPKHVCQPCKLRGVQITQTIDDIVRPVLDCQPADLFGKIRLNGQNTVSERMAKLISLAGGCGVTLHRAFDVCRDPFAALETAKRLGVDTILTSGQQADCTAGADLLRALVAKAGEDVQILVGAGVNADVIRDLQPKTGANAFHLSAKRVENSRMQFRRENVPMGLPGLSEFSLWQCDENAVRAAREAFDACCGAGQEART